MGKRTRKSQRTRSPRVGSSASARAPTGLRRRPPAVTKGRSHSRSLQELTVVATMGTMEEAKEYEMLLKNNDIPAMVRRQEDELTEGKHFAVIVPEDLVDEAHVVIESQDAYDDFYDFTLDDEEEDDFDGDIFEESS